MYIDRFKEINLRIKTNLTKEHYEKYQAQIKRFNTIRTKFHNTDKLKEGPKQLLYILETRSEQNNGDTKIRNNTLSKLLNKCTRTISRWFDILEAGGYIRRLTIKYKSSIDFGCYSDRSIRCLRVLLKRKIKPIPEDIFKHDFRPKFDQFNIIDEVTGTKVDPRWMLDPGFKAKLAEEP